VPRLVDLSQEIYQGMGVYPGHLKTVVWDHATHAETVSLFEGGFSFHSQGLMMCDHGPTHVDAISHLDPAEGAPSIDEMPLDTFYGPALCIDVSHVEPPAYVTADDLEQALAGSGQALERGDALLLRTGDHDRHGGTPEYTRRYTGLDEGAAGWLLEHGVKVFGVDSPSPDNPLSRTYPVHMMCRANGITHYENLANLDQVVGHRFTFAGFPLKIRGGTGSPVRAVAILEA
jgi:kynurenine formamidase